MLQTCGPEGLITTLVDLLTELDVDPAQIRFERFQAPAAGVGSSPGPAPSSAARGSAHVLSFSRSHGSTRITADQTLLDAAEAAGLQIASLCRTGVCGTCRTRVVSGDVQCASDVLSAQDREAGYTLPCVARAGSDCVLEA